MEESGKSEARKNIIKLAEEWKERIVALGYKYTPFGWLSQEDIKRAGLIYDAKAQEYVVPIQSYIANDSRFGRPKGEKYTGPSEQFLAWKEERNKPRQKIESQFEEALKSEWEKNELDVNNINF